MSVAAPEVLSDLAAVERLLPQWRELAASSATSALEAPDWLMPLAQRYLTRYDFRFLAWHANGRLIAVCPLALVADRPPIRPIRRLEWWGSIGPRMRGLNDVVTEPALRDEVLDSLCAWLVSEGRWDVLQVVRPQFGSETPGRLRRAGRAGRRPSRSPGGAARPARSRRNVETP